MKKTVKQTKYELDEKDIKTAIEFWIRSEHDLDDDDFDYNVEVHYVNGGISATALRTNDD